ncbi:MAG: hypothetical protein QM802_08175 [Agriterribacter sp.]
MNKSFIHIFLLFVFFAWLCPTSTLAQQNGTDTTITSEDSLKQYAQGTADSTVTIAQPEDDSDYTEKGEDTLFFLRKEDTTALYDASAIIVRKVPDSIVNALKNDDAFWYANLELKKKKEEQPESDSWIDRFLFALFRLFSNPAFIQIAWMVIIGLFVGAIVWFLIQNKMNIFGSSAPAAINRTVVEGEIDNIFTTDIKAEIEKAVKNEHYRLAIRLHYLQLLKVFSQNNVLTYRNDATNLEYLTQLYSTTYYKDFFKVTRDYEYAWYGETNVSKQQYESVQNNFFELYNKTSLTF